MKVRSRLSVGVIVAAVALLSGAILGGTADAKKKKGGKITVASTTAVPIPAATAGGKWGSTTVSLNVPKKKSKGKVVDAANSVAITFSLSSGIAGGVGGVSLELIAPNGRTIALTNPAAGGVTSSLVGPLTETADTFLLACPEAPAPCPNPDAYLPAPWQGTIRVVGLADLSGVPAGRTWLVRAKNTSTTKTAILGTVTFTERVK